MATIYIDVYFLINLTVDVLASHFASKTVHINTSIGRLLSIGFLGGALAIVEVISKPVFFVRLLLLTVFLTLSSFIVSCNITSIRKLKYVSAFLFFEILIGGCTYYGYLLLERYATNFFNSAESGTQRRDVILLSILILFTIGVLKILIMIFGCEKSIKSVRIRIVIGDKSEELDALVDSGNLVRDPMNMTPVLFVKQQVAAKFLPVNVIELSNIDELDQGFRKRIRLIPVTRNGETHVMTGVRTDKVVILGDKGEDEVSVTIAIDKEEGSYGGYNALMPSSVIEDGI